ncbi:MAG TPA: SsrA-binding protein SmpB [Patescibacteria group bacterium]|nr:SsrA-binding protein SmpB [Patescibacteria group bacterium]
MPILASNKRASFDYEFLEMLEGGLVLTGPEVKSTKGGRAQLKGSFLQVRGGELWLKNAFIAKYDPAGPQESYDGSRNRKVLIRRKELIRLAGKTQEDRLTLVPVLLYTERNLVKLKFAIARGKKKFEKRETIKKREVERQIRDRLRT